LLKGKPWRSFKDVLYHHVESIGTKAYTIAEMKHMFAQFSGVTVTPILTHYDTRELPDFLVKFVPQSMGWFLAIRAKR
jgi:hypothetical protein